MSKYHRYLCLVNQAVPLRPKEVVTHFKFYAQAMNLCHIRELHEYRFAVLIAISIK
jgi:hypothetical protein